jgi:hypothetical protein
LSGGRMTLLMPRFVPANTVIVYPNFLITLFGTGGQRVKRYLTSHGIREGLWFDPNGRHGQALFNGGHGHNKILRWLREPGS